MNTCEMCRWFGPMSEVNGNLGSCHRYPPRPFDPGHRRGNAGMFPSADFPVVTRQTSCGEHTPRESEASGRADQGVATHAPRSVNTVSPPTAGATAGQPYVVFPPSESYQIFRVIDITRYTLPIWMSGDQSQAHGVADVANAAYRAGQASMREPTPAMIDAGAAVLQMPVVDFPFGRALEVWDAMWKARDA